MTGSGARSAGSRVAIVAACWAGIAAAILLLERMDVAATRLIGSLFVFVGLAVAAWAVRGALRNAFVVACSLVCGFAVLEGALLAMTAFSTKPKQAKLKNDSLGGARPVVGWGPTKAGTFRWAKIGADGRMIYDTHVTIDRHLNRKTIPSDGPRLIAFWGDSWTFGDGVEDDGTLPQTFADLQHRLIPILNLSYNGWSPATNLVALQNGLYKDLLNDPRHFILFTATFHLERTACKGEYATSSAPRYVQHDGKLRFTGPCSAANGGLLAPVIRFLRKFETYNRIAPKLEAPDKRDVETYLDIIETFVAEAKRLYGVETTVLIAPFRDDYIKGTGYTEDAIVAALRKAHVDVLVDKLPPIDDNRRYWIAGDGHPTKVGNQARAREIAAHLREVDPSALEVAMPQASSGH